MKKMNENTKVTLTLGQLRRMVNEWYEPPARDSLSDMGKKDADREIKKALREVEKASASYNFRNIVNMLSMRVTSEQEHKILEAGDEAEKKIANALQEYKSVLLSVLNEQGYEVKYCEQCKKRGVLPRAFKQAPNLVGYGYLSGRPNVSLTYTLTSMELSESTSIIFEMLLANSTATLAR